MKYLLMGFLLIFNFSISAQVDKLLVVESFAFDSIMINEELMVLDTIITLRGQQTKREASQKKINIANQLAAIYDANVMKIINAETLNLQLFKVHRIEYLRVKRDLKRIENKHYKIFGNVSWYWNGSADAKNKIGYSIPRDSTTGKYLEVGFSGGMDIILAANLHANAELNIINSSVFKLSFSSKAGVMLVPNGEYYISYYAPGLKFSVPINNVWLTATYGKEYLRYHVEYEGYSGPNTDVIDRRIDIGLKFYESKNTAIEFYYPIRLDKDVIPWWTAGVVASYNYRF